jgi:hypothetical protein
MSEILYRAINVPAMQNRLCESHHQALSEKPAEIELVEDETGLIFNRKFNPESVVYDDNYQNEQGYSIQFRKHLEDISLLCSGYLNNNQELIVDIGCGKGSFVELLREKGLTAVGYDNAYQGDKPYIRKCFFGLDSHDQGDLLTLRHVLEHIPSPWAFLDAIAAANDYQGLLYIEVPDLDWILQNNAYFDLFHEHVNYFRAVDFTRFYGPAIIQLSNSFGGQYLSLIVNLKMVQKNAPSSNSHTNNDPLRESFEKLAEYERTAYAALATSDDLVIWGAASKGVVFSSKAPRAIRDKITFAIDINPNKHGRFMPLSGVEVLDPKSGAARLRPSSLVIIMNPNYEQEIRESLPPTQPCTVLHS